MVLVYDFGMIGRLVIIDLLSSTLSYMSLQIIRNLVFLRFWVRQMGLIEFGT